MSNRERQEKYIKQCERYTKMQETAKGVLENRIAWAVRDIKFTKALLELDRKELEFVLESLEDSIKTHASAISDLETMKDE